MAETKHYAFTFPNNGKTEECFRDVQIRGDLRACVLNVATNIILESTVRTSRSEPKAVEVQAFEIKLVNGNPVRSTMPVTFEIMPYQVELDAVTYTAELDVILSELPVEFHVFIRTRIMDFNTLEEGIQCAQNLKNELKQPIQMYAERIKKSLE